MSREYQWYQCVPSKGKKAQAVSEIPAERSTSGCPKMMFFSRLIVIKKRLAHPPGQYSERPSFSVLTEIVHSPACCSSGVVDEDGSGEAPPRVNVNYRYRYSTVVYTTTCIQTRYARVKGLRDERRSLSPYSANKSSAF